MLLIAFGGVPISYQLWGVLAVLAPARRHRHPLPEEVLLILYHLERRITVHQHFASSHTTLKFPRNSFVGF